MFYPNVDESVDDNPAALSSEAAFESQTAVVEEEFNEPLRIDKRRQQNLSQN